MKKLGYILTSIIVAVFTVIIVQSAQNWTDNVYEATHVAGTDLQNMENNFACLKSSFSGTSSPADDVAGQWWLDTTNHVLQIRNEADTGYLEIWDMSNDRPMGLDAPGPIGGTTAAAGTFTTLAGDVLSLQSNTEGLSGTKTIATDDPQIQFLDPDGSARDVTLPAEAENDGRMYVIVNTADGNETLTVKDDGGTTISEIVMDSAAIFACDGTDWNVIAAPGGGTADGAMLPFSKSSATIDELSTFINSYVTIATYAIYIPAGASIIYMRPRIKASAGTSYLKFTVNSTDSAETSTSSSTYAWKSEIACDVSGLAVGWTTLDIKMKSDEYTVHTAYLCGYTFRWGS